jgi:hypothetical protein
LPVSAATVPTPGRAGFQPAKGKHAGKMPALPGETPLFTNTLSSVTRLPQRKARHDSIEIRTCARRRGHAPGDADAPSGCSWRSIHPLRAASQVGLPVSAATVPTPGRAGFQPAKGKHAGKMPALPGETPLFTNTLSSVIRLPQRKARHDSIEIRTCARRRGHAPGDADAPSGCSWRSIHPLRAASQVGLPVSAATVPTPGRAGFQPAKGKHAGKMPACSQERRRYLWTPSYGPDWLAFHTASLLMATFSSEIRHSTA